MPAAHLDCTNGIAGDMLLGALVGAGAPQAEVLAAVEALEVEAELAFERRGPFTVARVRTWEGETHRHLADILALLDASNVTSGARDLAARSFRLLAEAEARVHGTSVEEVHFHEVGAADSIVDIVGAAVAFDALGITEASASRINLGSGTVECAHGRLDVPTPAVRELTRDVDAATFAEPTGFEMATPTGIAILRTLVRKERIGAPPPEGGVVAEGRAVGTHPLPVPRPLRVMLLEDADAKQGGRAVAAATSRRGA